MTVETAYKFKPSGQEGPNRNREYVKPRDELVNVFEQFLRDLIPPDISKYCYPGWYKQAETLLSQIDISDATNAEINSLLLTTNIREAGIFISAAYNSLATNDLVFDTPSDNPFVGIGHNLKANKRLLIRTDTYEQNGQSAEGIIINYGNSFDMGRPNKNLIINYGSVAMLGAQAEAPIINFGEVISLGLSTAAHMINYGTIPGMHPQNRVINKDDCLSIPDLVEYLEDLKQRLAPERTNEEIFAELRSRDIGKDLKKLLEKK